MKQNNNKYIILTKEIETNEKEFFQLIKEAESINQYYKDNLKSFDINYLITQKDIKLFNFIFQYLFKSLKYKDMQVFFGLQNKKIISKQNPNNIRIPHKSIEKVKYLISKFINFGLMYDSKLSKYFNINFKDNFLKLAKIFFLNDFIEENDLQMILFIQIILCLYKKKEKYQNIQNAKQLYLVIDYLISFCSNNSYYMKENKLNQFNNVMNFTIDIINDHIALTTNYINKCILARSKSFYNIINLSKISSVKITYKIVKMLVNVYPYKLKIDYVFDDLSDQFLYRTQKESLTNKTNLLLAKNVFINDLLEKEKALLKKENLFIKNGFYFSDCPNNGIICDSLNKFPNENDGYSIVVSFRLMNNNNTNENKEKEHQSKYTIFSIMNKENKLLHFYIEDNKLKLKQKKEKKPYELFDININCNYVLWIIQNKAKKSKMILYLNNSNKIINNIYYPEGYFKINLGFSNCNNKEYISEDNFVGIIGTFILFKKCLIKDENDNINITKLNELKGNYEDIIYVNTKREWGFIDKNTNWILNKLSNTIDIYKDIDIIISNKSLGNLDLLFDSNNILGELKHEIYCNYFKNSSMKNEVKFYFRNKNILDINFNFPIQLYNTFLEFLNNHIFLYLQLELYYFISLISLKIAEFKTDKNNDIKNFKCFKNVTEEEDFYLNISKICSLFFFCIDSLNSINCLNSSQEQLFQKEIDNFKYTLIDLISIYSKYNCKIKTYFLSLFVEKISEKKYFEYCLFILNIEFYDTKNSEEFDVLINYLNHISIDYLDINQIKQLFLKLIDFDKMYLSDEIKKCTKKEYSKLMRNLLVISIEKGLNECFSLYRKKIKKMKKILEDKIIFNEKIEEEEDNNYNNKQSQKSLEYINNDNNNINDNDNENSKTKKPSLLKKGSDDTNNLNNNDINNDENNLETLILIYKYLKNLYIAINNIKKKFIESCADRINNINEFFNDLFNILCQLYPIEEEEQCLKFVSSEKDKKEIIYAEYIKCLCIRFLDDLFFEENIKKIKDEELKNKKQGENEENDSRKGSSNNIKKSFNSCKTTIVSNSNMNKNTKNPVKREGSSNNLRNMLNPNSKQGSFISNTNTYVNVTIEGILTCKMDFFEKMILSQYTFKSFYLMLFRDLPNDKKIKIIKNDKNIKKTLLLNEKHFSKTRYILNLIIFLFEKQNLDGFDTLFMSKIELIEYSYNTLINLLKNMLDYYLKSEEANKKKIKPMINNIFVEKQNYYNIHKFYSIMFEDIIDNFNFNGCLIKNNLNYQEQINEHLDKLLLQIQKDITEFVDNTLFELIDPFYFKLLIELYFEEKDKNDEFIINIISTIIEKIVSKMNKENKNRIIEINSKNVLILLYKMFFYIKKRNLIFYSNNELFLKKEVILFLSRFIDNCNILYTKILFPIDETKSKLLIEIVYEIIFEMYLDSLRNPKIQTLQVSFSIFQQLFNEKRIKTNLIGKHHLKEKTSNHEDTVYTPFYYMDKIPYITINNSKEKFKMEDDIYISKEFYELKDYIMKKYKDEIKENKDIFSSCILFCIKIIITINDIEEYYKYRNINSSQSLTQNNSISDTETNCSSKISYENLSSKTLDIIKDDMFINSLKTQFNNICNNILKIHKDLTSRNPFKSIGYYSKNIYEYFRSFIVDKFSFYEHDFEKKINDLKKNVNQYKNEIKFFERVIYTNDGRTIQYTEKKFLQIIKTIQNDSIKEKDNESVGSFNDKKSRHSSEGVNSIQFSQSLKGSFATSDNIQGVSNSVKGNKNLGIYLSLEQSKSQNQIIQKKMLNKSFLNKNSSNNNNCIYNSMIKFRKDLIRKYFSSYFKKLLTYDEDFINIKKIYIITYNKEIKDINKYNFLYPTRLKNYITNNYNKILLKRDFDFFTDGYFKYSHDYLYNKKYKYNYIFQNKLLFPDKKLIEENDSAHQDFPNIIKDLFIYDCEMITIKGSIFGNIFVFDNCLLFKSELKNDKRKNKCKNNDEVRNYLDYACCTIEYDHLNSEKNIIIEYNNIKEVVNRRFFYSWISLEIFLKDGKSFLFNLFNEDTNDDLLELLKQKKILVIRKINEYFKKEEFTKKWKEGKITTFDYLLLLNKFSSRTYNDPNQYPIMPWLFLEEGTDFIRDFDLPISVQDEDKKQQYLSKTENYISDENILTHGNHYSTSAYTVFFLMRANPFTNNMIKFQSNTFDIPDRQYSDTKQTIFLCQKMSNNRELVPELFSIPEIYINLNDNDFGKQKDGVRVHNVSFTPYRNNSFEFCYLIKNLINNNVEINNNINKWFDFIFGVNQLGNYTQNKSISTKEKEKLRSLRRFNTYCYGQYYNVKKLSTEAQKYNKSPKSLFDEIKNIINIAINFGQCPYQLLNELHPSKKYYNISDNFPTSLDNISINDNNNARYNSVYSDKSNKENKNNIIINQKIDDIYKIKGGGDIIYFRKSSNNNYLYCLLSNRIFEIYKYDNKNNNFALIKTILPKCQFLFLKKTKNKNLIFKPKYLFCEINENIFICCRTLDKTLILYNYSEDFEASFLLNSHTTAILSINNNEFITGHDRGRLCKWRINYSSKDKKVELELLQLIKSNVKSITCLVYSEKLNIIAACDIDTIIMRKNQDFEYLNSINIKNIESYKKNIVDVKISDYNFIYALIYIEEKDSYELQGFTINGTYFGKYSGYISNFEISKSGKIIIGEIYNPFIKVLDPVKLNEIYKRSINIKGENIFFHFYFERPNLIYCGVRNNDSTRIKLLFLDSDDDKYIN